MVSFGRVRIHRRAEKDRQEACVVLEFQKENASRSSDLPKLPAMAAPLARYGHLRRQGLMTVVDLDQEITAHPWFDPKDPDAVAPTPLIPADGTAAIPASLFCRVEAMHI